MKKLSPSAAFIFCALLTCAFAACAASEVEIYEASGTLLSLEETDADWLITLLVNRQQYSGLVAPDCQYYVNDTRVTREEFIARVVGEQVTVEFHGDREDVSLCRGHVN